MTIRTWFWTAVLAAGAAAGAWAGTFGKVVSVGGHASDLALDEGRGVLYVANFTANRVDVVSIADQAVRTSINVPSQPSSVALSRDGKYLVVAHYANYTGGASNALTVINLDSNSRQTYALAAPPLGVAFGADNQALVATASEFMTFDPATGSTQTVDTIPALTMKTLPQPTPSFPPQIAAASLAASRDGMFIYGLTDTIRIGYDVRTRTIRVGSYVASPPMGPRVVSVSDDGSKWTGGWALWQGRAGFASGFYLMSQFPSPAGLLNVGSHAIDSSRNLIYAQVPKGEKTSSQVQLPPTNPVLQVVDGDNLAVLEQLRLAENLAGKSVISSDYRTMYAISDSGVTILPIGTLSQARRVTASQKDLVFRGSFCDRRPATQEFLLTDSSGANSDFKLTTTAPGVTVSPTMGSTPARIKVTVDPAAFQGSNGTSAVSIDITSKAAANVIPSVRVLVNTREPDQRGTFYNVPGKLVDILSDPGRNRFYLLRQDTNEVLVYDAGTYTQIATFKTGNTPTQMAMTFDRKYLLVGGDNTQMMYQFDLDTLQAQTPIPMPPGHYPRSVAAASSTILIANRVAGPKHFMDRLDLPSRTVSQLSSLGVFENDIDKDTVLMASPNGNSIVAAQANGTTMLFSANANTFTVARRDQETLSGAIAASNYDQYVIGDMLLNSSLVPIRVLDAAGQSSGFAFVDQGGFRLTAQNQSSAGVLQRIDTQSGDGIKPTRVVEAPILSSAASISAFTRTLAPIQPRNMVVALTASGFTVLPWDYDAATAPPKISAVVNAGDGSRPVAPGGLISVYGSSLSPVTQSSSQTPLPTVLGDSCLTVNGLPVPIIYVSGRQINAQLPFAVEGSTTLILRTPGGISDSYNMTVSPSAPSIFRAVINDVAVGTVLRNNNGQVVTPSNPVHRDDILIIYATGLGKTFPEVPAGEAAPANPLSFAISAPSVSIGGVPVEVLYAGLAPGQVGVYQINVRVNSRVPLGWNVPLEITQGATATSLDVRVVQ